MGYCGLNVPRFFLNFISDEPVFLICSHQQILKNTGQDRVIHLHSVFMVNAQQELAGGCDERSGVGSGHSAGIDGLLKPVHCFKVPQIGLSRCPTS